MNEWMNDNDIITEIMIITTNIHHVSCTTPTTHILSRKQNTHQRTHQRKHDLSTSSHQHHIRLQTRTRSEHVTMHSFPTSFFFHSDIQTLFVVFLGIANVVHVQRSKHNQGYHTCKEHHDEEAVEHAKPMNSVFKEVVFEVALETVVVVDGGCQEGDGGGDFEGSACFDHLGVGGGHIDFYHTITIHANGEETVGI